MGKTHSKPLAARHGRGTAWARHAMCESACYVWISLYEEVEIESVTIVKRCILLIQFVTVPDTNWLWILNL